MISSPTRVGPLLKTLLAGLADQAAHGAGTVAQACLQSGLLCCRFRGGIISARRLWIGLAELLLLSGVYGGDPHEMSVNSVLGPFAEMEKPVRQPGEGGFEIAPVGSAAPAERCSRRCRAWAGHSDREAGGRADATAGRSAGDRAWRRGFPGEGGWRVDRSFQRDPGLSGVGVGGADGLPGWVDGRIVETDSVYVFGDGGDGL